jgi:CMP-N,N'-diacetyllegionaminic acid synthase
MADTRAVALIPARAGSRRVPGKNTRSLAGHPLLAYTVAAALDAGVFDAVVVSTECERTAAIARHYGARAPFLRPAEQAGDTSPDIEWVEHALLGLAGLGEAYDCFSILRPTSPFRQAATIRRAMAQFLACPGVDSLRAVERCRQHPGKMWVVRDGRMVPLLPLSPADRPWHSMPYQALPEVFVQNASLEIAWSRVALEGGSIAGRVLVPFFTEGLEGFDVNTEDDWFSAECLVAAGRAALPAVARAPWQDQ